MPLLEVEQLQLVLPTARGPVTALRGLSFAMQPGDTLGLVGESGCGKSLTALALMGLLPDGAQLSGQLRFQGQDLTRLDERAYSALRGRRIAMVFQEPMSALNPLHRVGHQVAEPLRLHLGLSARAAEAEALRLLDRVGLGDARRRMQAYPHELSGGQRQRVCIAMALACGPELLIADEPTTALDASLQAQILALLAELVAERGMGLILISHDLGVMAQTVQRVLVMYGGLGVELGPTAEVFARPAHPYTQGLLAARPRLGQPRGQPLSTIAGQVPDLHDLPTGCPFSARCPLAQAPCAQQLPPPVASGTAHQLRCLRWEAARPLAHQQDLTP